MSRARMKGISPVVEGEADIGPDQGQFTHGKVEDARAFVDEGPAQSDHEGIDASNQNPRNEEL